MKYLILLFVILTACSGPKDAHQPVYTRYLYFDGHKYVLARRGESIALTSACRCLGQIQFTPKPVIYGGAIMPCYPRRDTTKSYDNYKALPNERH